jgi:hypothetical protein
MKQLVFAVYDSKAELFNQPMFFTALGEAIRAFGDEANRSESAIYKHPNDYSLFQIGEYYQETGLLESLTTPKSLGLGIEYIKPETPSNQIPLELQTVINEAKN